MAFRPDLTRRDKAVETASGAEIDHPLARLQDAKRERVAEAGKSLNGAIRQGGHGCLIVAEPSRQWASGVEVVAAVRIEHDGAVFGFDLLAQGKRINMSRPPKLTPAQQAEARRRRAQGATLAELARSYGVGKSTITRLKIAA